MFDQPENARKPYFIVLSLILQIAAIGALCVAPFVFPHLMPAVRLRDLVLAAPPRARVAVKTSASSAHIATAPRSFVFIRGPLVVKPTAANNTSAELPAPGFEEAEAGLGVSVGIEPALATSFPTLPPAPKPKPDAQRPIRVGTIDGANLIHMVQPAYPPIARASHIQGTVEFTATISKEGAIENLMLVKGHPLLINAAKAAVLQWRYRPTLLKGQPVEVITDIVVNFGLSQ